MESIQTPFSHSAQFTLLYLYFKIEKNADFFNQ